jgi:adenylate kinase family enzyme
MDVLVGASRVAVIGSPGAGKSSLAARLAAVTSLPLVNLDREFWQPGWVESPKDAWDARVVALANAENWIIDGNYARTLATRLGRADLVIFLDPPVALCLWRAINRVVKGRGRVREDMAAGCPERWDFVFFQQIMTFRARVRPGILQALAAYQGRYVHLKSRKEIDDFLAGLATASLRSRARRDPGLPPG